MNFYVRYMDMNEYLVDDTHAASTNLWRFFNKGIQDTDANQLNKRVFRANSKYGPDNNAQITNTIEYYDDTACLSSRFYSDDPLEWLPTRNTEWELSGSQIGWATWDMTSKEVFKEQLVDYHTHNMRYEPAVPFYNQTFGEGFRELDYNVIIYWGYPLYNGKPYDYLCTLDCIYIGNTPLADEIIAG